MNAIKLTIKITEEQKNIEAPKITKRRINLEPKRVIPSKAIPYLPAKLKFDLPVVRPSRL
jgi:hypothetical protein